MMACYLRVLIGLPVLLKGGYVGETDSIEHGLATLRDLISGYKHRPVVAVSLGDPAGVGPEMAAKALILLSFLIV